MLYETEFQFSGTTWRWLSTGLVLLDPFDYKIAKVVSLVPSTGEPTMEFTGEEHDFRKDSKDRGAANKIHADRLGEILPRLPQNDQLGGLSQDESKRLRKGGGSDLAVAVMNPKWVDGAMAIPVAVSGAEAAVGTHGAATCLAVLARATGTVDERAVACSHFSANDMDSLETTVGAIKTLHKALLKTLGAAQHGTAEYYLVGGQDDPDDPDLIEQYARVVGAIQQLAPKLSIALAGARLPASDGTHCADALITPTRVAHLVR